MIYVKVENEVNKISFRFWKRYAVSSYLICNRVTLTFPFLLRQLSIHISEESIFSKERKIDLSRRESFNYL